MINNKYYSIGYNPFVIDSNHKEEQVDRNQHRYF